MRKRLITASLCALGVAAVAAGPASAAGDSPFNEAHAQIQVFGPQGLERVISCPTLNAAPECAGTQDAYLLLEHEVHAPFGTPTDAIGAFRYLDGKGGWTMSVANNDASDAIMERTPLDAKPVAGPGAAGAASGKAHAKKPKKPAKKKRHGRKAHH
jgi:hypothetical protein